MSWKQEVLRTMLLTYGPILAALIIGLAGWGVKRYLAWRRIWRSPEVMDAMYEDPEDDDDDPEAVYR